MPTSNILGYAYGKKQCRFYIMLAKSSGFIIALLVILLSLVNIFFYKYYDIRSEYVVYSILLMGMDIFFPFAILLLILLFFSLKRLKIYQELIDNDGDRDTMRIFINKLYLQKKIEYLRYFRYYVWFYAEYNIPIKKKYLKFGNFDIETGKKDKYCDEGFINNDLIPPLDKIKNL